MFDRNEHLVGTQVINYAASADGNWLMVVGIKAGPVPGGPAVGCMQLYSVEKRVSQPLDAHAGCFTTSRLPGRTDMAILFCFVQKKPVSARLGSCRRWALSRVHATHAVRAAIAACVAAARIPPRS
jgi:clathrin heavy chain